VIDCVLAHLRNCGAQGLEGVVFWAGRLEGSRFLVTEACIPRQHALTDMQSGVGVAIDGDELFRLNVWLHKAGLQMIAQIHSHPGSAYHSSTDDALSVVTRAGALSIVVPYFAAGAFDLSRISVHRLTRGGGWKHLSTKEVKELLQLGKA
jgi:hypothetical protein